MTSPDIVLPALAHEDTAPPVSPGNWRSGDYRDRLRYPVAGGSDAWSQCVDLAHGLFGDTPARLFDAYEECLTALQDWVSRAADALADRTLLPSVHPSAPTFRLHLLLPALRGSSMLGVEHMQSAVELQRQALTLSVRLMAARVCEKYNDNGHPAVVRLSDTLKWANASLGEAEVAALPELSECGDALRAYERRRKELEDQLNALSEKK